MLTLEGDFRQLKTHYDAPKKEAVAVARKSLSAGLERREPVEAGAPGRYSAKPEPVRTGTRPLPRIARGRGITSLA